jgi:hypothetical protein
MESEHAKNARTLPTGNGDGGASEPASLSKTIHRQHRSSGRVLAPCAALFGPCPPAFGLRLVLRTRCRTDLVGRGRCTRPLRHAAPRHGGPRYPLGRARALVPALRLCPSGRRGPRAPVRARFAARGVAPPLRVLRALRLCARLRRAPRSPRFAAPCGRRAGRLRRPPPPTCLRPSACALRLPSITRRHRIPRGPACVTSRAVVAARSETERKVSSGVLLDTLLVSGVQSPWTPHHHWNYCVFKVTR